MDDADVAARVERAFRRYRFERPLDGLAPGTRTPHGNRRLLGLAGAGVLAVALWAALATPFAPGPTVTFAGWRPAPDAADTSLAAAATGRCQIDGVMKLVAQDQRGNAATLVYADGNQLAICLVARDSAGDVVAAASGVSHLAAVAGSLSVDTGLEAPATGNSPGVRILAGRAAAPIAAVNVTRADGVTVSATVRDGYFVAWWPNTEEAASVSAFDRYGSGVEVKPALP